VAENQWVSNKTAKMLFFSLGSEVNIVDLHYNNHTMKEIITELTAAAKANPLEFTKMVLTITGIFAFFYAIIWIGSAIGLQ
jgi:hypothetical protein